MNFEELKKINASLKTMDIKGKKYIPVNERVKAFRMLVPDGTIMTEMVKSDTYISDTYIIVKAQILVNGEVKATGYAEEKRGSSNINNTSPLENCETSAVGRALGFFGIGIDTAIASADEINNVARKKEVMKLASRSEKEGLMESCKAKGIDIDMLLTFVGFDRDKQPEGMTIEQYVKAMDYITKEGK